MASQEGDILVDLESVGAFTEEEGSRESIGGVLSYNGTLSSETDTDSSDSFTKSSSDGGRRVELFIEGSSGSEERCDLEPLLDKKNSGEQRKKPSLKKASKPPRPPKGPSLNAYDLKLVRELSELAARKRARIERMKAVRRMKEAKRQNSNSSLIASIITVFFFLIILLQGRFSQTNVNKEFQGSPAPAVANEGLISIQLFDNNAPANQLNAPISTSLNSPEQIYGLSPGEEEGRDSG